MTAGKYNDPPDPLPPPLGGGGTTGLMVKVIGAELHPPPLATITGELPAEATSVASKFIVICVPLTKAVIFTTPLNRAEESPFTKPEPLIVTTVAPAPAVTEFGAREVIVARDPQPPPPPPPPPEALIVKICAPLVPLVLVTVTFLAPVAAPPAMLMFTVIEVALFMTVEFVDMPAPEKEAVLPAIKLVPVKFTFKVCPCVPLFGARDVKVGAPGGGTVGNVVNNIFALTKFGPSVTTSLYVYEVFGVSPVKLNGGRTTLLLPVIPFT